MMLLVGTFGVAALGTVIRWRCGRRHPGYRLNFSLYKVVSRKVKEVHAEARNYEAPANGTKQFNRASTCFHVIPPEVETRFSARAIASIIRNNARLKPNTGMV
jgi:hypothetical protein